MLLQALADRLDLQQRIAVVVAHQDDETIAAGASLRLMPGLLLVHVTDGAPRRLEDATRSGFENPGEYGLAREAELQAALRTAGVAPKRARLRVPDQDATMHLCAVASELGRLLPLHGIEAVLTHAYEGGHPDHDATAFAVHLVARRLGLPVFEFPAYHAGPDGETEMQRFLPGPAETLVRLDPAEAAEKRAMLDCFRTQGDFLQHFSAPVERFRPAPGYDFLAPPHPGRLNYENWNWDMTGERWRQLASQAINEDFACGA